VHHHFTAEQWLPYPVQPVFAFFANPANLPPLMPAWQKARIERAKFVPPPAPPDGWPSPGGVAAGAGTTMTIKFRPFPYAPFTVRWDAEITEFAWNDHFCDVQHRGPFAFWRHCHRLQPQTHNGVAGTLLRDEVEYALPLGPLGDVANAIAGKAQFRAIFNFRHRQAAELLPQSMRLPSV
jgi:ligand-binding SRPBCC domain-containing protein